MLLCSLPIDPEALKSALLNLIFNAFQAMPDGGLLTYFPLKMEDACQISSFRHRDRHGRRAAQKSFSPFFTTKQKGNGLGLVETQKIVQAHYGTSMSAPSQAKGRLSPFLCR